MREGSKELQVSRMKGQRMAKGSNQVTVEHYVPGMNRFQFASGLRTGTENKVISNCQRDQACTRFELKLT